MKKTWEYFTIAIGIYTLYRQLKALKQAQLEIYNQLTEEQKAKWDEIFGAPKPEQEITMPFSFQSLAPVNAPTVAQLESGT